MTGRIFLGIILVLFGALFLLGQADVIDSGSIVSVWWPLILIAGGIFSIASNKTPTTGAVILLLLGVVIQASKLDYLPDNWGSYIFPVIIIVIGLWVLFGRKGGLKSSDENIKHFAMFSGLELKNESNNFTGGSITAMFGGIELDISNAQTKNEVIYMDVTALFGGVEVTVPEGWKIETSGMPLFGGWENKTRKAAFADRNAPVLKIRCFAAFGGIEIKN